MIQTKILCFLIKENIMYDFIIILIFIFVKKIFISQFIYDYKMIFVMRLDLRAYLRLILVKVFLLVAL